MNKYPNMTPEIMEAVCEYYKDDDDILTDCLLHFVGLNADQAHLEIGFVVSAMLKLDEMGRCNKCGEKLKTICRKEPHPELDEKPVEKLYESYCPNCEDIL